MKLVGAAHSALVHPRRVRVLADLLAPLIPNGATLLDVGCGDGLVAASIAKRRPDVSITGVDVLARPGAAIPVATFDGLRIPLPAGSVDVVMLVDVLHHAASPEQLLADAVRVARHAVVLKDHVANGPVSRALLRIMDLVGNRRFGVALPHRYLSAARWDAAIQSLPVRRDLWQVGGLRLYPGPADWVFGRDLHVLARLSTTA